MNLQITTLFFATGMMMLEVLEVRRGTNESGSLLDGPRKLYGH
jgi:hypothetical protein